MAVSIPYEYIKSKDLRGMEEKLLLYKRYKDELQQIEKRMLELETKHFCLYLTKPL